MRALGAALLLLFLSVSFANSASAEMIKWVDEKGTIHFAGSVGEIPPQFRPAAEAMPEYSPEDERVRIIPAEPEEQESRGWMDWVLGESGEAKPQRQPPSSPSTKPELSKKKNALAFPEFTFLQGLGLVVAMFFGSIVVLAACTVLIGEEVEHLGGKAFASIFAQRFLMCAAFLWISHTTAMNFVPQAITLGDVARALLTPVLAELGIMTLIVRYTICDVFARAIALSVIFCVVDGLMQGLLLLGAIILVS